MSDNNKEKPAAPAKPKSSRLLPVMMVIGLANLGATGFVTHRLLGPIKVEMEHKEEPKAEPSNLPGPILSFDPFVVNLNEPGSTRYLKTVVDLEVSDPKTAEQLTAAKPIVRDEVLGYLSSLSVVDTQGEAGKAKIRNELARRLNEAFGEDRVRRVFFAEFVVQ